MTFVTADTRFQPQAPLSKAHAGRKGFWRNMLEALMESRRIQAEREIARYIALQGGVLTDTVERGIENRFLRNR